MPSALPRGLSIADSTALTRSPRALPTRTMASASFLASSIRARKAPRPTFTSKTRPSSPSTSFFDMIEAVMSGSDGTVAVTSLNA